MKIDKVLWLAMVFSTFIYAVLVWLTVGATERSLEDSLQERYTLILYGMALCAFVMGLILPNLLHAPARVRMIVALAIFESCVIFGLMAAFLVRDWRLFVPAWIAGLAGMLRAYPRDVT